MHRKDCGFSADMNLSISSLLMVVLSLPQLSTFWFLCWEIIWKIAFYHVCEFFIPWPATRVFSPIPLICSSFPKMYSLVEEPSSARTALPSPPPVNVLPLGLAKASAPQASLHAIANEWSGGLSFLLIIFNVWMPTRLVCVEFGRDRSQKIVQTFPLVKP